jgi:hypothetical protein
MEARQGEEEQGAKERGGPPPHPHHHHQIKILVACDEGFGRRERGFRQTFSFRLSATSSLFVCVCVATTP